MLSHFRITLRHCIRYKWYFLINSMGLATGIAFCILIFLFVRNELTYDLFHRKADRIFRVVLGGTDFDGDAFLTARTPIPLAPTLHQQFPEIARACRLTASPQTEVRFKDSVFSEEYVLYADPSFFNVFSFPLSKGESTIVLNDRNSIVLTKAAAEKYFGNGDPIGKQLTIQDESLVVAGITENIPHNSSIQFDVLIPFDKLLDMGEQWAIRSTRWNYSSVSTYIELLDTQYVSTLEGQLPGFAKTHFPDFLARTLSLQPIEDVHLNQDVQYGLSPTEDPQRPYILTCIAFLVLFISCINFMNLAICRSSSRATEVGIRKAFGAQSKPTQVAVSG